MAGRGRALCGRCRATLRFLGPVQSGAPVWAAVGYEGPARALVGALKFRGALAVADPMAALMVAAAPVERLRGALVPVPLHPARRRRRGFNQAERLARALGRRAGLPVEDCLVRGGRNLRQVGRDRPARLAGPAGSVRARGPVPRPRRPRGRRDHDRRHAGGLRRGAASRGERGGHRTGVRADLGEVTRCA